MFIGIIMVPKVVDRNYRVEGLPMMIKFTFFNTPYNKCTLDDSSAIKNVGFPLSCRR